MARKRSGKLARRVARTILDRRRPRVNAEQKRMFKVMKRKMMGLHAVNILHSGGTDGQPKPPWWLLRLLKKFMQKVELTNQQLRTWTGLLSFELEWWKRRGWLNARSFDDLARRPVPEDFDVRGRLLKDCTNLDRKELAK